MKIQFIKPYSYDDVIAEFEIADEPTNEQCEAIEYEIFKAIDDWYEENNGDMNEFDYWVVCLEAARKHLKIVDNPVVKTFYL